LNIDDAVDDWELQEFSDGRGVKRRSGASVAMAAAVFSTVSLLESL
jgi:hypothetical protein